MNNKILSIGLIVAIAFSIVSVGLAYSGSANVVIENVEQFVMSSQENGMTGITTSDNFQAADLTATDDLVVTDDASVGGDLSVTGSILGDLYTDTIAEDDVWATTTLLAADSGTTYYVSASGTTITLPAVADGLYFRFAVNGAITDANVVIDSAEGDNIEGTLIVAGAVVDCAAEDQINIVYDGENIGDYVELYSDGSQWLIGDSGALTASKLTCTDPS